MSVPTPDALASVPSEPMLTRRDIAETLNVSLELVRDLLSSGELPHYKIRRSVRIHPADLHAYLERCRTSRTEDDHPQPVKPVEPSQVVKSASEVGTTGALGVAQAARGGGRRG